MMMTKESLLKEFSELLDRAMVKGMFGKVIVSVDVKDGGYLSHEATMTKKNFGEPKRAN